MRGEYDPQVSLNKRHKEEVPFPFRSQAAYRFYKVRTTPVAQLAALALTVRYGFVKVRNLGRNTESENVIHGEEQDSPHDS